MREEYQAGFRQGYADEKAGNPWPAAGTLGSHGTAGYRHGRQHAAEDRPLLAPDRAMAAV
jgi:hypothetical protein